MRQVEVRLRMSGDSDNYVMNVVILYYTTCLTTPGRFITIYSHLLHIDQLPTLSHTFLTIDRR